jgi:hypothetical protein
MQTIVILLFSCLSLAAAALKVAPNILVSRESGLPKVELMIAANPKNGKNLIATAIAATPFTEVCTVYATFDGGYTWKSTIPPGLPETGSGDPQVAFGADGAAYFSALGLVPDQTGRPRFSAVLFRSGDGGSSWEKIATFASGSRPDHDMMATDESGRLFISLVYSERGRTNVGVYRLDPGESTLRGPFPVSSGTDAMMFTWNPVVFSDGTLFVPYQVFNGEVAGNTVREIFAALSGDGGTTFVTASKIGSQRLDPHNPVSPYGNVVFAADSRSARFHDRLYMLWNEASAASSGYRLTLAASIDKGRTWMPAVQVDRRTVPHRNAFRPAIAVNSDGAVGISWLDTRDSASGRTYREYFTASLDGGATFLDPVAVASADSSLDSPANFASHPTIDSPRTTADGNLEFSFITTLGRFPNGGDYMGLTSDADGTFHPLWTDTRTGTFQAWTAAIRVDPPAQALSPSDQLSKQLSPRFDPASYDPATGVQSIPVRFQNVSGARVCAPLKVTVSDAGKTPRPSPRILNADNHRDWDGASFDYTRAFRDRACLEPGEMTEAIVWRVKPLASEQTFVTIRFSISQPGADRGPGKAR